MNQIYSHLYGMAVVLIEDCVFNTKDDGVAIKAGRNADGRR